MTNDILTPKEVAEELRTDIYQVYKLINSGKLKAYNIGDGKERRYFRIFRRDLEEFLK